MALVDSLDKVIGVYFAAAAKEPFVYKDVEYKPKPLVVSPLLLRGFTCPVKCGGCCPRFSLDYLPAERKPDNTSVRKVKVSGKWFSVYSDLQVDRAKEHFCRNLNMNDGRCNIHAIRPFSCDFELIRFLMHADHTRMQQRLFGRGWAMQRVDGKRGALCTITPADEQSIQNAKRKVLRLKDWMDYFCIGSWCDDIVKWIDKGAPAALYCDVDMLGKNHSHGFFPL